jgi:glycerol kinase
MQFMADILGMPVIRSENAESTGRGAAFLAGLACGFWRDQDEILKLDIDAKEFLPGRIDRQALMSGWHKALDMAMMRQG